MSRAILGFLAAALASGALAFAATKEVLERIALAYEGRHFRLGVTLYEPAPGGQAAPSLDERGWRGNDPNRPAKLLAGDEVEVTGVFDYGEASVFLEISRKEKWTGGPARPRVRVRFTATAPPEDPEKQAAQLAALIRMALREIPAASP
jgi:hypothetical protein